MIDKEKINKRLLELEGKELEGEEAKEWARLVAIENKIADKKDEKEERDRKKMETVPTDMEGKKA